VLIFRSFFEIGFKEAEKISDNSCFLTNKSMPYVTVKLEKNDQQIIKVIINDEQEVITIIPMPSTKDISKSLPKPENNKYYFSLFGSKKRNDVIKISPTEINSEEQISNIFLKYIFKFYTDAYLYKLSSQKISNFRILNDWLKNNTSLIQNKGKNGKVDFWLSRKLNNHEISKLDSVIASQKQNLSARSDIRSNQLLELKEINEELKVKGKEHFENYENCISCSKRNQSSLIPNYLGGFKYECKCRGCEVEYGFTEKGAFYKVPDYEKIVENLLKINDEINQDSILNAFGFEHI
jgi:hypothetical protein